MPYSPRNFRPAPQKPAEPTVEASEPEAPPKPPAKKRVDASGEKCRTEKYVEMLPTVSIRDGMSVSEVVALMFGR